MFDELIIKMFVVLNICFIEILKKRLLDYIWFVYLIEGKKV